MTKLSKIDKFFYFYGKFVLVPAIILLIGLLAYLYVTEPQSFVYDCSAYHIIGEEPEYAEGVFLYGLQLHEGFYIERLSLDECKQKQALSDRITFIAGLSIITLIGFNIYKYRKKIKEVLNDEGL